MVFWGAEVKPGKPFIHRGESDEEYEGSRLHLSQATLGLDGQGKQRTVVKCKVGDGPEHLLCSLTPGVSESCSLDLLFDQDVVFSVTGSTSVHLVGYYVPLEDEGDDDDYVYDEEDSDENDEDFVDDEDSELDVPPTGVTIKEMEDELPKTPRLLQIEEKTGVTVEEIEDEEDSDEDDEDFVDDEDSESDVPPSGVTIKEMEDELPKTPRLLQIEEKTGVTVEEIEEEEDSDEDDEDFVNDEDSESDVPPTSVTIEEMEDELPKTPRLLQIEEKTGVTVEEIEYELPKIPRLLQIEEERQKAEAVAATTVASKSGEGLTPVMVYQRRTKGKRDYQRGPNYLKNQRYQPKTLEGCEGSSDDRWTRGLDKSWICTICVPRTRFSNKPLLTSHRINFHNFAPEVAAIPLQKTGRPRKDRGVQVQKELKEELTQVGAIFTQKTRKPRKKRGVLDQEELEEEQVQEQTLDKKVKRINKYSLSAQEDMDLKLFLRDASEMFSSQKNLLIPERTLEQLKALDSGGQLDSDAITDVCGVYEKLDIKSNFFFLDSGVYQCAFSSDPLTFMISNWKDMKSREVVFFPVCDCEHWVLIVAFPRLSITRFLILNSLPYTPPELVYNVRRILSGINLDPQKPKSCIVLQDDSTSCGMFILFFIAVVMAEKLMSADACIQRFRQLTGVRNVAWIVAELRKLIIVTCKNSIKVSREIHSMDVDLFDMSSPSAGLQGKPIADVLEEPSVKLQEKSSVEQQREPKEKRNEGEQSFKKLEKSPKQLEDPSTGQCDSMELLRQPIKARKKRKSKAPIRDFVMSAMDDDFEI